MCQSLCSLHPLHGKVRAPSSGLPPGNKSGSSKNQRSRIRSCIFRPGSAKVLHSPKLLLRLAQCPLGVLRQARASRSYLPLVGNNTPTPPPHYCARFARAFVKPPPWAGGPGGQVWFTVSGTRGHPRARAPSSSFQPLRVGTLVWQFSCVRRPGYSSLATLVRQTGRKRPACTRFFSGGFTHQHLPLVVEYQKNQKTAAKSEH